MKRNMKRQKLARTVKSPEPMAVHTMSVYLYMSLLFLVATKRHTFMINHM